MTTFTESHLLASIPASQSIATAQRARDLIATGKDIISVVIGEPDFATPASVIDAAARAAHQGQTRYTPVMGTPQLRAAVARKFSEENQLDYDPNNEIIIGTGAKQLIYEALMATLNPGDEVIICAPYWVSYPSITRLAGALPRIIQTDPCNNFVPTAGQLDKAINKKTRWLVLNYPNNPSGAVASAEQYAGLAEVLEQYPQIHVLSDEIYEHICYDGLRFHSFAASSVAMKERTLVVNGISKAYAMTGWRIGYAAGPKALIALMAKLQSHVTGGANAVSQAAALAALNMDQQLLKERQQIYQRRRDLALEILCSNKSLEVVVPKGAFYIFVRPRIDQSFTRQTMADFLLNYGVAVAPGEAFGAAGWFRISIAIEEYSLKAACERIVHAFNSL